MQSMEPVQSSGLWRDYTLKCVHTQTHTHNSTAITLLLLTLIFLLVIILKHHNSVIECIVGPHPVIHIYNREENKHYYPHMI